MCFLAIDTRGLCRPYGSGSQRCIQIHVPKCKYLLSQGSDLTRVAGLFRTNWFQVLSPVRPPLPRLKSQLLQLFALNPLFTTPEAVLATDFVVIDIGKHYTVLKALPSLSLSCTP